VNGEAGWVLHPGSREIHLGRSSAQIDHVAEVEVT
jgi:hypothetical protein